VPGYVRDRKKQSPRKDAQGRYQARWRNPLNSQQRIEKTFPKDRLARRWITQMDNDAYAGSLVLPRNSDRLFKKAADDWRDTWVDLGPKTRGGYESILNHHVLPRFGDWKVGAVSGEAIQTFLNELAAEKAPNTVRRIYSVISGVMSLAVKRRYVAVNPCGDVKLPRGTRRRKDKIVLTAVEVRQLAEAMKRRQDRLAVYVAAYTGVRAGELWALRRRDVGLDGRLQVRRALKWRRERRRAGPGGLWPLVRGSRVVVGLGVAAVMEGRAC
jgi:integrase